MENTTTNEAITVESIAAEAAKDAREAYSTPKLTQFGTIQKITAQAVGSQTA